MIKWLKFIGATLCMLALLLLMLIPYGMTFGDEHKSLTISPFSLTMHGVSDQLARDNFKYTFAGSPSTTLHPGISLLYKDSLRGYQAGAFYFLDSFGNQAGGLAGGPLWDVLGTYLQVGLIGGLYARERPPRPVKGFPISIKSGDVEIAPLAAGTVSMKVPLDKTYGVEVNCSVNWMLNNCQVGLRIEF